VAVKGIPLAMIGAGGILAWSGLNNKKISQTIQDLVRGTKPQPGAFGGVPFNTPGLTTSGSGIFPVTAPSNASEKAWAVAQLASIGAPPTPGNIAGMVAWSGHEAPWNASPPDGAQYTHNPLNTTLSGPGVVGNVNSVGVKIYNNWVNGIAATSRTLLSGYPDIVSRLRSGAGLCGWSSPDFSKWSGGGYSSVC
jgi:hypothetical protein